jgi:hypothetical protein
MEDIKCNLSLLITMISAFTTVFFFGSGIWTQSFMLAKQEWYRLSHSSSSTYKN